MPFLQTSCGRAHGNVLLLLNVCVCVVLNTKELVRPVSAAIQPELTSLF